MLTPRPDRVPVSDRDPYIQFHDQAQAMGWLGNRWGMNDAGWEYPLAAPGSSLVTCFQVGIEPVPGDRPLPVQPFLRCAGDQGPPRDHVTFQGTRVSPCRSP